MNSIYAFIFIAIAASGAIQASQPDMKKADAKSSATTKPQPAAKAPAKPNPKQPPTQKEKSTPQAAPKKLKVSSAATAALLRQSASPGYIAPFAKKEKSALQKTSSSSVEVKVQAQNPVLKKNPIFTTPLPTTVQKLGDVEIGNSSKKSIEIISITFSHTTKSSDEKKPQTSTLVQTHKITFPRGHIIPSQKKLAFTISMKNKETLQFAGIKSIETASGIVVFDQPITDLKKPIILTSTKKGKIRYAG